MAGEASSSEGGLRKIVSSLARALNKNECCLADAKKKLTFDGANITEFLIDYENLAALLKWTEEEKMDHLGQHVSLSLGRDIMAIVAASRSWKETRDVMMRKYLAAEKMATEADLAAVQRKNFATYNDVLQKFTLVALRIPGVTDRIMSKYFLREFSEFDKDKILSAYQQTSKFVNTRDVDFSTVTDLAEKMVMTETLALLKEEAEPVVDIIRDQLRGRGPHVKFILENDGRDRVNATTRQRTTGRRINRDTVMEEFVGSSEPQAEHEAEEPDKVYGKPREEEPADKVTAAKKKFRYQIPILTLPEIDDTISKLLGTMVSVFFQTMLQARPRLLKGLRQLLTRRRVEIADNLELPEGEREEEAPQEVANLQRSRGDLEDLEKAFADIRLSLPDREGGEFMRSPPGTKLNFHALPVGKLKIQIGTHHTGALVDGGAEITLIRRYFATITGYTVNKEVTGSIREAGGEIPFVGGNKGNSDCSFFRKKIPEGSVRKYKPVGKKAKSVSILLETSKEEAMEKEEEVLQVIRERRATEGHRISDEVADTMKIGIDGFLTEEETRLIKRTCQEFYLTFAFSDHQKGRLDAKLIPPVRIHTIEYEYWNDKGSSYEFGIAGEVTDLLRAKMNSFVAEPTASPYANRWFVFRNPNKPLRWIQDLQKLNAVTIRDTRSLPQADLLAESHAVRSIYSLIDLYSRYNQLPLDVRDRPYTAMHTPVGQLQMQVTPMGFINAVAEVQRKMLVVAGDMFPEKCEPYIDDNPIKGAWEKDETEVHPGIRSFVWDHLQDIKDLLRRFLVYNITASGPKSILAVPEVTVLGFRCGVYGRKPNPAKTDKISQWSTPLPTTTEVRAFLGVVGFWRIFIKNFAKIVEPIRAMIREEGIMDWTAEREGAAQKLKDILTSETVALSAPCFNDEVGRPFILETDGGTLNSVKRRYLQFKKEVLAILHCLKTFQAYLFGRRFILRIDPTNVAGALKNYRPIDPTVGRWVGFIWQFDYKIKRIAGIRNKADGRSQVCITPEGVEGAEPIDAFLEYEGETLAVDNEMMSEECISGELLIRTLEKGAPAVVAKLREGPVTTRGRREENDSWGTIIGRKEELIAMAVEGGRETVMSLVESWERKELQWVVNQMQEGKDGGQEGEEFFYVRLYEGLFREIGLLLVENKQPTEVSVKAKEEAERYILRGGHLFRREEGAMPRRIECERSRQVDVIQAMHDGLAGGHRSSKGTLAEITPLDYWPGMTGMVAIYCQTCLICQERSSTRVFEPLRSTLVLGLGHLVHLDLEVMPVSTDGYRYILDARDNLSGFVEAGALKKKTGRSVADWIEDFNLRHPFVRKFIADNGTEFVNQEVLGMLKRLCVPIKLIEPYHPEANARVAGGHRTLKNMIAKLAADHLGNWPRYLKQTVFAENMTPKRTTGCILAELWYGREIDFPVEALVPTWNRLDDDPQMTTGELIEARCQQILKNEEVMEDIANRLVDSRMRDKARWDQVKNVRKESLLVGEMVLLRNSTLEST
ncbi:hypothetical protein CBR_g40736 [Chara braunii]|uniref:Integrase catalytic domain-containing protein n=1 Tax=Chara braunii TaxID=69332 RepID=A0A388LUK3_CHABU|nr:hypothetical protein CBR_g40736 [Chara braunii]|eukprot:GBG85923.1 hypothetical protein CBR_g40736 [Chara braunii]